MKKTRAFLGLALAVTLCLSIFKPFAATPVFSDVPANHWAFSAIESMASKEVVSGVGGGKFNPDGQVSTGQFVTMMTRAFYPDALAAAESPVSDWWGANMFVAHLCGMTKGTTAAATETPIENGKVQWDSAVVDAPMNRYDMAQVMYNYIWSFRDMPSDSELAAVKAKIADFSSIPAKYQTAVLNVFALNCLTGVDATGRFAGDQMMSRAQAAVVLGRIFTLKEQGSVPTQPNETPVTPTPTPTPSEKPSYGKPPADTDGDGVVTAEEVTAMLAVLKEKYPEGTPWGSKNSYSSPIMGAAIECAAWAYMASDSIFSSIAPARNVTDVINLRVGDMVYIHSSTAEHWAVVTEIDDEYYSGASGNVNGKVSWEGWGRISTLSNGLADGTITIYTRYPR